MDQVIGWFNEYGYWILFMGLFLEFLFMPFPGGTVMAISGILAHQGRLDYLTCILLSVLGTSSGITITYFIGRKLGSPFFEKHGAKFFMGPKRRGAVESWFGRFGNKVVFFSFFIPGIRHFTGYFSGIMKLRFRDFILYTIGGAASWAAVHVSLGYYFGRNWKYVAGSMTKVMITLFILLVGVPLIYVLVKRLLGRKRMD